MKIREAANRCLEYHQANSKESTLDGYRFVLTKFTTVFGDREVGEISSDEILSFLSALSEGRRQATKRSRYSILSAFFTFVSQSYQPGMPNPCDSPILRKLFRAARYPQWEMLDKETVDEVIFRIPSPRDRLIVELMARGGLRVSEVLKLKGRDAEDRKLTLRDPKSGREEEVVFIPQKLASRLWEYIREKGIGPEDRIFPITYGTARMLVRKAGNRVGVKLRPHDLRRHAATYASRAGTPIEIVSKVILRHANLSTTQRYLGRVSDVEALRWIELLYG
jgi:integrase